jgi:hypothetical protein
VIIDLSIVEQKYDNQKFFMDILFVREGKKQTMIYSVLGSTGFILATLGK